MGDLCPTSHNLDVPFVKKTEMQVCHADADTGECHMMLDDQGNMKEDLFLPSHPQDSQVSPSDEDMKIAKEILEGVEGGKKVLAIVQAACGMEKIIGHKTTDSWVAPRTVFVLLKTDRRGLIVWISSTSFKLWVL